MSDNSAESQSKGTGFNPYRPPTKTKMTIEDFEQLAGVFKRLVDDSGLKWWIILAGMGALVDILHTIWLAIRYLKGF